MPLRAHGATRKRWRYVGVYGSDLMLCAARAQIGPATQCFWALWDARRDGILEGTSIRPGSRIVTMDGPDVAIDAGGVKVRLHLGESAPIESMCPSGNGWGWTQKRAGIPVTGTVEVDGEKREITSLAVDDQSAGYHARHTEWFWSAGVGTAVDGSPVAWNLVTGINDPVENSERSIWVAGVPQEPEPVVFDGLDAVRFADGHEMRFSSHAERARNENMLIFRSKYRHRFGEFTGSLGGIELATGLGVMEHHEAVW